MSDFNPITLFFILYEGAGAWLWLSLGLALALFWGVAASVLRVRRVGRSVSRPLAAALLIGFFAALLATFVVPVWTLAGPGALGAAVDYIFAFLFALAPGAILGALTFMVLARRNLGINR